MTKKKYQEIFAHIAFTLYIAYCLQAPTGLAAAAAVVWTAGNTARSLQNMNKVAQLTKVAENNQERSLNNQNILEQLVATMNDATTNVDTINREYIAVN